MPSPKVIELAVAKRFIRDFIPTYFDVLGREFDRAWKDFKDGFPNPVLMVAAAVGFFTGVSVYPLYTIVENFGRSMLPNAAYYRRFVITGEDAFKLCTEITGKVSLKAGLIDLSFAEQLIQWLATRIWNSITGQGAISRLLRLMRLTSYDDVLLMVKSAITKNIALQILRIAIVWFSIGYAMITMVALGFYWDDWFEGLQQDNPRKRGMQRNRIRKRTR